MTEKARVWLLLGRLLSKVALWLSGIYLLALWGTVFVVFPFLGEGNPLVAMMLYFPRAVWLVPAVVVVPLIWLLKGRRWALLTLALIVAAIPTAFGLQFHGKAEATGETILRLASYNRGQHGNESFQPFLHKVSPDVVVMQDAARRAKGYRNAKAYERFPYIEDLGEFLILSRFPIVDRELVVPDKALPGKPVRRRKRQIGPAPIAAKFVVALPGGERVAIYNVHTMTVRDRLKSYLWGRALVGVIGLPGTPWAKDREEEEAYWEARWDQLNDLVELVAADEQASVVAGDFNVPTGGRTFRRLLGKWREAHQEVGWGAGHTFPGKTRNPLSLGGPWMRLDHVFYEESWRALESVTEGRRLSQHRAVFAVLQLK